MLKVGDQIVVPQICASKIRIIRLKENLLTFSLSLSIETLLAVVNIFRVKVTRNIANLNRQFHLLG